MTPARIRILGPGGEFVGLSKAEQKTVDSKTKDEQRVAKRKAGKAKAKAKKTKSRFKKIKRIGRAVRTYDYTEGGK